jgi:DNA modification methylase
MNLEKFKRRTWLDGRIVVINDDCQKVMAEIGDKEIDLVVDF